MGRPPNVPADAATRADEDSIARTVIMTVSLADCRSADALASAGHSSIGRDILIRQKNEGWGARIIDRLSDDLTKAFPDMRGFRARNLKYMRAFAEAYPVKEFVQQVVAQLPWGHQVRLLDTVKDVKQRD
jgi:predicted nuclease of restriction endonuclease-like (RecB) superfamily